MVCANDPAQHTVEHNAVPARAPNGDAQAGLDIHNNERKLHGVPALQWDADLAHKAQDWANHLAQIQQMVHSDGSQRPGQGENLFSGWTSAGPYKDPLKNGAVSRKSIRATNECLTFSKAKLD